MTQGNDIIFEMPTIELFRGSLKIINLLQQAKSFQQKKSAFELKICVNALLDLLTLLDRPELRSKYIQEFTRILHFLTRLKDDKIVDSNRLSTTVHKIKQQLSLLSSNNGKFAEELRANPFFKNLLQYHHVPGADCGFNTPDYYLWLNQPVRQCMDNIDTWLLDFKDIESIVTILLQLTRETGQFNLQTAPRGFYQQSIDRCHLIRLKLSASLNLFPKITVGQHGVSIQFFQANLTEQAPKATKDVPFGLAYCYL